MPSAEAPGKEKGRRGAATQEEDENFNGSSRAAQRQRLLAALRKGAISTLRCRRELDVLHPAAGVMGLREDGHNILTAWRVEETDAGIRHRVAEYVLLAEAPSELR
jgi:hypothetical protein